MGRAPWCFAAFLALAAALLWPAPFGDAVLSACAPFVSMGPFPADLRAAAPAGTPVLSDAMHQFEPWLRYAADAFARTGALPLWKDSSFCGAPFVGNAQSAVFWPPNLVAILLGAPAAALAWLAMAKLVAGALGALLLARHLGVSRLGAFLAGLVFAFGGFSLLYLLHPHTNVSALLPWLVLCADRAALRPSARRAAAVATVAALQHLGGHPETAFHCQALVALLVWVRAASIAGGPVRAFRAPALLVPAAGLLLGAVAAAIQLLPFLEYLRESEALKHRRSGSPTLASIVPSAESLAVPVALVAALLAARRLAEPGRRLVQPRLEPPGVGPAERGRRLAPAALGLFVACAVLFVTARRDGLDVDPVLHLAPDWFGAHDAYAGFGNYVGANGGYAGAALALAIFAVLCGPRRGVARVAAMVLVVALLVGHAVPVVTGLVESLPLFALAANARLQLVALLAAAVLAGVGLDALGGVAGAGGAMPPADLAAAAEPVTRRRRRFLLGAGALVLAALVALPVSVARGHHQPSETAHAVRSARPMVAGVAPAAAGTTRRQAGWVAPGVPVEHALLLFGRGRFWPAALVPLPSELRPRLARAAGPAYGFHADVPRERLREGMPYRVLCRGASGEWWLSPWLSPIGGEGAASRWALAAALPEGRKSAGEIAFFLAGVLLVATGCGARGARLAGARAALVLLAAASLLVFGRGFPPTVPEALFYPSSPAIDALARLRPDGRHALVPGTSFLMQPETGAFYGLMEPAGYDALGPSRVVRLLRAAGGRDRRLLGLMSVEAFAHSANLSVPGEVLMRAAPGYALTANEAFLPRARVVPRAVVETDDERALALLRDPAFDLATTVVLATAEAPAAGGRGERGIVATAGTEAAEGAPDRGAADGAPARIVADEPGRLVVDVTGNAGGHLVLSDTHFPGWRARVDGVERKILRANLAFRAVPVARGDRRVSFDYAPASFRAGLVLSGLAVLAIAGLSLLRPSRGDRARPPGQRRPVRTVAASRRGLE